jgi:Zn-dependent membrane protease YugP
MLWVFDPRLLLFIVPGLLLGLWAQFKVRSAYERASRIRSRRGLTGAATARMILEAEGVDGVQVEPTQGFLSDHYHPLMRRLRLSEQNYSQSTLAAVGVAAHEVGHAIQHARHYGPLNLRTALMPLFTVGSVLGQIAMGFGVFLAFYGFAIGQYMLLGGIAGFSLVLLFSLITLPVEFNASRRALRILSEGGYLASDELPAVKGVLNAAALTYVAAAVSVLGTLLQMIFLYDRARR